MSDASVKLSSPEAAGSPVWSDRDLENPHAEPDKATRVRRMFAQIAPAYDLNNRLHSMGRDQAWRKRAVRAAGVKPGEVVLDVACGTGDLSEMFRKRTEASRVIGMDFTYDMLAIADRRAAAKGLDRLTYHTADAMSLPLADASVDVVSIAFGIRNVAEPRRAFAEFYRVLKPGGRLVVLEFSLPKNRAIRGVFDFYFSKVMPMTCGLVAGVRGGGGRGNAYKYLARSVHTFMDRAAMTEAIRAAGLADLSQKVLTMGVAVIYRAVKR